MQARGPKNHRHHIGHYQKVLDFATLELTILSSGDYRETPSNYSTGHIGGKNPQVQDSPDRTGGLWQSFRWCRGVGTREQHPSHWARPGEWVHWPLTWQATQPINMFKGTQAWEYFALRYWNLYFFVVSYAEMLRFRLKKNFVGLFLGEIGLFCVYWDYAEWKIFWKLGKFFCYFSSLKCPLCSC